MNLFVPGCATISVVPRLAAVLLTLVALSSCSSASKPKKVAISDVEATTSSFVTTAVPTSAPTTAAPSTSSPLPTAAGRPAPPSAVTLSEPDNGTTVSVPRGAAVTLVLHSTYWTVDPSSNPSVLSPRGSPAVDSTPPGQGCVPGQGCGTITAQFAAVATGTATISAHRSSCGEALRCTPEQSSYRVTVRVSP